MTSIKLSMAGAKATAQTEGTLTAGMTGLRVQLEYDAQWDGLYKTLVCQSDAGKRCVIGVETETTVPAEVLRWCAQGKNELWMGVEGRLADGSLVLPSTMAYCGKLLPGAMPEDVEEEREHGAIWAQIQAQIGALKALKTDKKENLVAGINELVRVLEEVKDHKLTEDTIQQALGYVPRRAVYTSFVLTAGDGDEMTVESSQTPTEIEELLAADYAVYATVIVPNMGGGALWGTLAGSTLIEGKLPIFNGVASQISISSTVENEADFSVCIIGEGDKWYSVVSRLGGGTFTIHGTLNDDDNTISFEEQGAAVWAAITAGSNIQLAMKWDKTDPRYYSHFTTGWVERDEGFWDGQFPVEDAPTARHSIYVTVTPESIEGYLDYEELIDITIGSSTQSIIGDGEAADFTDAVNELIDAKLPEVKDGVSVTVAQVQESTEDGGENVVTFSDGSKLTIRNGKGGSGGTGGSTTAEYVVVGTTPQKLTSAGTVRLECAQECDYTVQSPTVAELNISGGSGVNAAITEEDGVYCLRFTSQVSAWYSGYVDISCSGLNVGESYTFVFDAAGVPWDGGAEGVGHWILYDGSGATLLTRDASAANKLQSQSFVATTENVRLRWYPAAGNAFSSVGTNVTARVNRIYIDREGYTEYSQVVSLSGSFTGSVVLGRMPVGVTIDASPECSVLLKTGGTGESKSRHSGKRCVCFGDSVTGNMQAPYDYPSILAEETGMEVVNAGFGGCRMSDTHPTAAYAAFSMVKLAEAVVSGDWSVQEENVSDLSTATNGVEHLAALKAVDWTKVDFITIAYGTNDIQNKITLDDASDEQNTKTYLGALRYALTKLLTAYPHIKVLLLTPIYRYWNDEDVDSDSKDFDGRAFTDWGDGLLTVAERYKLPAMDLYRTLGFNAITRSYYFPSTDGTHPNPKGLAVIGGKIAGKLLESF